MLLELVPHGFALPVLALLPLLLVALLPLLVLPLALVLPVAPLLVPELLPVLLAPLLLVLPLLLLGGVPDVPLEHPLDEELPVREVELAASPGVPAIDVEVVVPLAVVEVDPPLDSVDAVRLEPAPPLGERVLWPRASTRGTRSWAAEGMVAAEV